MLYNSFKVIMMLCSVMGILFMFHEEKYTYIIFPTALLIGGVFSFFDLDDREYLRRNNIDYSDAWFLDWDYDTYGGYNNNNHRAYGNNTTYRPSSSNSQHYVRSTNYFERSSNIFDDFGYTPKRLYKELAPKCKRSFKISIDK